MCEGVRVWSDEVMSTATLLTRRHPAEESITGSYGGDGGPGETQCWLPSEAAGREGEGQSAHSRGHTGRQERLTGFLCWSSTGLRASLPL